MPMYMFSGTFFALSELPHGVRLIASVLPLTQGVELCRSLSLGNASAGRCGRAQRCICWCSSVGGIVVARVTYRRRLHP